MDLLIVENFLNMSESISISLNQWWILKIRTWIIL